MVARPGDARAAASPGSAGSNGPGAIESHPIELPNVCSSSPSRAGGRDRKASTRQIACDPLRLSKANVAKASFCGSKRAYMRVQFRSGVHHLWRAPASAIATVIVRSSASAISGSRKTSCTDADIVGSGRDRMDIGEKRLEVLQAQRTDARHRANGSLD